jgi:hypothetical protein
MFIDAIRFVATNELCFCSSVARFGNIPSIHCYNKWESVEGVIFFLRWTSWQPNPNGCQSILKPTLHKAQIWKTSLILYTT